MTSSKAAVQQNDKLYFRKGHYLEHDYMLSLSKIEIEKYDQIQCINDEESPYTDARDLLKGSCNLFALALNERFGYDAYQIQDSQNRLAHVFCKAKIKDVDVYIDVRGITTEWQECIDCFPLAIKDPACIIPYDLEEDRKLQDERAAIGYSFAKAIVEEYQSYYDVDE